LSSNFLAWGVRSERNPSEKRGKWGTGSRRAGGHHAGALEGTTIRNVWWGEIRKIPSTRGAWSSTLRPCSVRKTIGESVFKEDLRDRTRETL